MNVESFNGPLLIYGVARSGTTYLLDIINNFPGVRLVFESDIIAPAWKMYREEEVLKDRQSFDKFLKKLSDIDRGTNLQSLTPLFTQPKECYDRLYEQLLAHRSFSSFVKELYTGLAEDPNIWGDKSADLSQIPIICELFPKAKFIFIIRDVRDVVCSFKAHSGVNYYSISLLWVSFARLAKTFSEKRGNGNSLIIQYENLVSKPKEISKQIGDFIGRDVSLDTPILEKAHNKSIGKWRHCLSQHEVRLIEELAFVEMKTYGYTPLVAKRRKRINWVFYGLCLVQHAGMLLWRRRALWKQVFSVRAARKYLGAYRGW